MDDKRFPRAPNEQKMKGKQKGVNEKTRMGGCGRMSHIPLLDLNVRRSLFTVSPHLQLLTHWASCWWRRAVECEYNAAHICSCYVKSSSVVFEGSAFPSSLRRQIITCCLLLSSDFIIKSLDYLRAQLDFNFESNEHMGTSCGSQTFINPVVICVGWLEKSRRAASWLTCMEKCASEGVNECYYSQENINKNLQPHFCIC